MPFLPFGEVCRIDAKRFGEVFLLPILDSSVVCNSLSNGEGFRISAHGFPILPIQEISCNPEFFSSRKVFLDFLENWKFISTYYGNIFLIQFGNCVW